MRDCYKGERRKEIGETGLHKAKYFASSYISPPLLPVTVSFVRVGCLYVDGETSMAILLMQQQTSGLLGNIISYLF